LSEIAGLLEMVGMFFAPNAGNYARAVDDVTKAFELTRKGRQQKRGVKQKPAEASWSAWAIRKLTN
jgi:hypothetical protein